MRPERVNEIHLDSPWVYLSNYKDTKAFIDYLRKEDYDIVDTYERNDIKTNSVQLGGSYTPNEIISLVEKYDDWKTRFHEEKLKKEFAHLAGIIASNNADKKQLLSKLRNAGFEYSTDASDEYITISTTFFSYTYFSEDSEHKYWYLGSNVYCFTYDGYELGRLSAYYDVNGEIRFTNKTF